LQYTICSKKENLNKCGAKEVLEGAMMKRREYGEIKYVERRALYGTDGFFIGFSGKEHMIDISKSEFMWISAKLAHDLGLIANEHVIPAQYEKSFVGRKIVIVVE
jgi:hypothetical protein